MNPLIGEGRWTVEAAIEEAVAADVITAALFTRFRSRQDYTFCEKMPSAMRFGFGGHVEAQTPVDPEGRYDWVRLDAHRQLIGVAKCERAEELLARGLSNQSREDLQAYKRRPELDLQRPHRIAEGTRMRS